jgi:hypothetical protein
MGLHGPFGHLQHKLWQKERPGVKLAVWFSTTKSWESTQPQCVQVECNTPLESSQGELQVCFKPHLDRRSEQRAMPSQSYESPNRNSFETPSWESWDKKPFGCRCYGEAQIWGKVVASPEFGLWWVLWVQGNPWFVLALKVFQKVI